MKKLQSLITFTRITLVLAAILASFAQGVHSQSNEERLTPSETSRFAAEAAYPYYTSDPYGRNPSRVYPDDPADFFARRKAARKMVQVGDCAGAERLLVRLVDDFPDDPKLWMDLGLCQDALGENRAAIQSLKLALELGTGLFDGRFQTLPAEVMVRIGMLYARLGEAEKAIAWVRQALDARYAGGLDSIAERPDAARLKDNAEFAELVGVPPGGERTREQEWLYDIAFLGNRVAQLHFDPDFRTSAEELERMLLELTEDVQGLTDAQIVARLMLFMGSVGSGHDALLLNGGQTGAPSVFPMKLYFFDDGLYVIDAADETLIGARVDAFGDTSTNNALDVFTSALARDNNMGALWSTPRHLTNPVLLEALGIVDDAATATLTITDRSATRRVIAPVLAEMPPPFAKALAPPPSANAPLYLSRLATAYWTASLDAHDALFVQVNGMFDANDEDFESFVERVRLEGADPNVKHLIVDLRHNSGGNDYLTNRLLRALIQFDMNPDKGELYVLIGRGTYSAAQIFVTRLEALSNAVFVGEPTSSRPTFIGRTGSFTLPYSGLSGYISSELSQSSWPEDHRIWVAPDVPVGLSSEDFFAGRDPALEAVLEIVTGGS